MLLRTLSLSLLSCAAAQAQFSASVALPGDMNVLPSAGTQSAPELAFGGAHYLAVWEDSRSGLGGFVSAPDGFNPNRDVYGVLLDSFGAVTSSSPLVVDASPWDQTHVHVAWNGQTYLVVWESTRPTQFYRTQGIYAARVDPSGQVLDDPPIVIDDEDDYDERFPVVASDGAGWMVAWADRIGAVGARLDGAYVDASGLVLFKRTLVPSTDPLPANFNASFAGGRFGVVFERNYNGTVGTRVYDTALNQVGAETVLTTSGTRPVLGSNGAEFYAAWRSGGVRGTPLTNAGTPLVAGGALLNGVLSLGDTRIAVGWNGSQWRAGFSSADSVHAADIDAAGAVVGTPYTVSFGALSATGTTAANGSGRVLLAWKHGALTGTSSIDPFDIYATRLDATGGAPYPISVSPPAQVYPAIAGDPQAGYLVAYLSRSTGQVNVLAQRVRLDGTVLDAQPILLASGGPTIGGELDVAFDGAHWLVAWSEAMPGGPPVLYRTFARRVGLNGQPLDPAPIDLQLGDRPVTAALNGEFLVVSHYHYSPVQSNHVLHYKRVRGVDGVVLDPTEVYVAGGNSPGDLLAFDDRYLLVWGGVSGIFIDSNGVVGAQFLAGDAGSGSSGVVHPKLARNGDEALIVWEYNASLLWNSDLRARRIRKDGTFLDLPTGSFVAGANNAQFLPSVAWCDFNYLVCFTDFRDHLDIEPGLGDVYATRVSSANQVLDPQGAPAQNRWPAPEGRTALVGAEGRALLVSSVLDGAPFGTWRIHVQTYFDAASPHTYCTAKTNTLGCEPTMGRIGTPSLAASSGFVVTCSNVRNHMSGLLFYGTNGAAAAPFQGGYMCVALPTVRTPIASSGGTALPTSDCSGVFSLDMNARAASGVDPALATLGTVVRCQQWSRDPGAPFNTSLSNALSYVVAP